MACTLSARRSRRAAFFAGGLLFALSPLAAGRALSAPPVPTVWSVAFSPDGKSLASGSYQKVQLWDVETRAPGRVLAGHAGAIRCLAWSQDGKQLAAGGGKPGTVGEVKIWSLGEADSQAAPKTLTEHKDVVEGVAFSTTGGVLVSAGVDEKALPLDLASGKVVRPMTDHTNRVVAVAVSSNGKYVATGSLDRTIKIWGTADYKPLANIDNPGGPVHQLTFLPDGNTLVVAGEDGNTRMYRLSESRTGRVVGVNANLIRNLNGNRRPMYALAASLKGNLFAVSGEEPNVTVYDSNGGRKHSLKECTGPVYSLSFSPDGTLLAAGCRDGKVRIWTMSDGKLAAELAQP